MTEFRVELRFGFTDEDTRIVQADSFLCDRETGWIYFYRHPPQGGKQEYWRVQLDAVVSMETRR